MVRMRKLHLPGSPAILRSPSLRPELLFDSPWRSQSWKRHVSSSPLIAPYEKAPFRFETGIGVFAKRTPRPFPPPFLSPPSISFSDPLSTHDRSRDRRAFVNGELIRGRTNGDDAVYASGHFICANDGVGAWTARPRGHAGLWSRLMLHFWAIAIEQESDRNFLDQVEHRPNPVASLQIAYEKTQEATSAHDWQGTTTACGALLHYKVVKGSSQQSTRAPLLYVTNLGDGQILVLRPRDRKVVFKTKEQWHWFDCPRQLGTNSPDTPVENAVLDVVDLEVGDVVLAMSDGVIDNLWEHEIADRVFQNIEQWKLRNKNKDPAQSSENAGSNEAMETLAHDIAEAARAVATDAFAESPYMERAIDEGLASEGGKLDDISVVAAICVKND